jgi:hypothetical protein
LERSRDSCKQICAENLLGIKPAGIELLASQRQHHFHQRKQKGG